MKLLLVDDHALFREALALLIAQAWPCHAAPLHAGSLAEAERLLDAHPDTGVVLLDLALPDAAGLQGLQRLRRRVESPPCLVMSAQDDRRTVLAAIDAGAAGFISKTHEAGVLLDALKIVAAGGVCLPVSLIAAPADEAARAGLPASAASGTVHLSPRQLDVLQLLIEGKSNKRIGADLGLSASTVKTHLEAIFTRLGVASRTEAVVASARLGLRFGEPGMFG